MPDLNRIVYWSLFFVILEKLNFQKHYYIGKSCFALVYIITDDRIVVRRNSLRFFLPFQAWFQFRGRKKRKAESKGKRKRKRTGSVRNWNLIRNRLFGIDLNPNCNYRIQQWKEKDFFFFNMMRFKHATKHPFQIVKRSITFFNNFLSVFSLYFKENWETVPSL